MAFLVEILETGEDLEPKRLRFLLVGEDEGFPAAFIPDNALLLRHLDSFSMPKGLGGNWIIRVQEVHATVTKEVEP